jgi:hypothetical protein
MLNSLKMTSSVSISLRLYQLHWQVVLGTDLATRRQAAADVLQALVSNEAEATEIVPGFKLAPALRSMSRTKKKTEKRKTVPCTC